MSKKPLKIVFTGGPSTGKTTVLNRLKEKGYCCMEEISREIIQEAQKKGTDQLFLSQPLLFSELLFKGRKKQFFEAGKLSVDAVFLDRGLPDVFAYLNYINKTFPIHFIEESRNFSYDRVFYFPPWQHIHTTDGERYESFEQAKAIANHIVDAYRKIGYQILTVPLGTVQARLDFIIDHL